MIRFSSLVLCLGLAGLTLAHGQTAKDEQTSKQDAARRAFYGTRLDAETHELMQGVWSFTQLEWNGFTWKGQDIDGIAVIGPGHFSMEIHARIALNFSDGVLLQTGTYSYIINALGQIEATTMIGASNLDDPESLRNADRGRVHTFRVQLANDLLILERPGSKMTMRRLPQPKPPFHDRVERAKQRELKERESKQSGG